MRHSSAPAPTRSACWPYYDVWSEPITSLVLAALAAAVIGVLSGLVLLRTKGLTLLMLTLCTMALLEQAANMAHAYTGGFDGLPSLTIAPVFGVFEFNPLYANTQYLYALGVLLVCFVFVRTLVYSPFGQSLTGIRENVLRMHAIGSPVRRRLVICYTISAAIAGIAGGLWAQTNAYVNLERARVSTAPPPCSSFSFSAAMDGSTARSSAPSSIWRWSIFWRRSIRPPGSSASACCWW